jgi:hypothetical protein
VALLVRVTPHDSGFALIGGVPMRFGGAYSNATFGPDLPPDAVWRSVMRLKTNLRGQVRQTALPKWKCLLPLFEAVMNSFQAIQEADPKREHSITVDCKRDNVLDLGDELAPFVSFTITDTGVGFNDANFESFNTAFSEYKFERGGKGLGRIMWLVAFDKAEINSIFIETDSRHPWRRKFTFDTNYDPDRAPPAAIEAGTPGTTIVLSGFKTIYREECPRSVESLAQRLIEHFVLILLRPDCPKIELCADGQRHSINAIFRDNYQATASETTFSLRGVDFTLHGFKITSPRANKHRLIYAANSRGVLTENLDEHIPNLSSKLVEEDGSQFVYLAIVQGQYLDQKVNNYRTDFDIAGIDPADAEARSTFPNSDGDHFQIRHSHRVRDYHQSVTFALHCRAQ